MQFFSAAAKSRWSRLALILAIIGPGIITANVDNDAGGIATYSLAGGNYGLATMWTMIPVGLLLFIVQEMSSRLGAVTGKGLADLIRENFGLRLAFWVLAAVGIINLGNTMSEFAGIASASEILFGPGWRYVLVPLAAFLVWWVAIKGSYRSVEKVFLAACVIYLAYPVSGFLAHPHWGQVLTAVVTPQWSHQPGYVAMLIGIVGTTIAPWMQFYQQASVVDKGITAKDYKWARLDVLVGCIFAIIVVFFIVATCASTIYAHGLHVDKVEDAAQALRPLAGNFCATLFALGLLNASLFAASILPLATAYQMAEGIGWERGLNRSFSDAPEFYTIYTLLIVLGAGAVMLPKSPLLGIMYWSQVLNGLLLPVVLVLMLMLINKTRLMGSFTNTRLYNYIAWACVVLVSGLGVWLGVTMAFPKLGGG